jgi:hypothetical protein
MSKNPYVAAGLNFFFPGSGYIYAGRKRALGVGFLLGAIGLTLVEQSDVFFPLLGVGPTGLETALPAAFGLMFAAVFIMNTCFAIDAFQETRAAA